MSFRLYQRHYVSAVSVIAINYMYIDMCLYTYAYTHLQYTHTYTHTRTQTLTRFYVLCHLQFELESVKAIDMYLQDFSLECDYGPECIVVCVGAYSF